MGSRLSIGDPNNNLIISQRDDEILRHLTSNDAIKAKQLSVLSFPIYYPMHYFIESFNDKRKFFSIGIFLTNGDLLGFLMALPNYPEDEARIPFYSEPEKALIQKFNSKIAYIASIAVNPTSMRRGYGTILINALNEACAKWESKPDAIFLHVKSDNQKAMNFYEKMGFVMDSFVKDYYNDNSHAYIYVRILNASDANIQNESMNAAAALSSKSESTDVVISKGGE